MKLSIPFCFSLCLTPYSLQSGNHLSRTLLHAFLASYALIIINMGQIAQILEVSEPRISQIHSSAIRKLKAYMGTYM